MELESCKQTDNVLPDAIIKILLQHSHLTTIIYIPYESYKCNHYIRLSVHCHNGKNVYNCGCFFILRRKYQK